MVGHEVADEHYRRFERLRQAESPTEADVQQITSLIRRGLVDRRTIEFCALIGHDPSCLALGRPLGSEKPAASVLSELDSVPDAVAIIAFSFICADWASTLLPSSQRSDSITVVQAWLARPATPLLVELARRAEVEESELHSGPLVRTAAYDERYWAGRALVSALWAAARARTDPRYNAEASWSSATHAHALRRAWMELSNPPPMCQRIDLLCSFDPPTLDAATGVERRAVELAASSTMREAARQGVGLRFGDWVVRHAESV